jgi:alkanesulfonate monooxygenase SsuD/methylene tetrahydromethanopterin reductase-like flavin-dependent oxidoreductase (luciferase family)
MGPKAMRRAAEWADGVSGFSITASGEEIAGLNRSAHEAWASAGRTGAPRLVNGTFCVLGGGDPAATLREFTFEYLQVFGERFARAMADAVDTSTPDRVRAAIAEADAAGCDEFILVPGTVDLGCLHEIAEALDG